MKRGYIFSLDAAIAILIVAAGIFVMFSQWNTLPDIEKAREISKDMMSLLFDVKVKDICTGDVGPVNCSCLYGNVTEMYCLGRIDNVELTLLEVIGKMYKDNPSTSLPIINELINETITRSNLVPENYGFTFLLTDLTAGPLNVTTIYPVP